MVDSQQTTRFQFDHAYEGAGNRTALAISTDAGYNSVETYLRRGCAMNKRTGLIWGIFVALFAAIIVVSCKASRERVLTQPPDGIVSEIDGSAKAESPYVAVDDALDEIANYRPAPDVKVDPLVFEELRAALAGQIEALARESSGGINVGAPQGDAGRVTDLKFDRETNLLTWTYVNKGDYDQSGEVGVSDISPIAENYLAKIDDGVGNDAYEKMLDGDGNGEVGIGDVTAIAENYLNKVAYYETYSLDSVDGERFHEFRTYLVQGDGEPLTFSIKTNRSLKRYLAVQPISKVGMESGELGNLVDFGGEPGARGDWWMYGHDPQNTKRSSYVGTDNPTLKWKFRTTEPGAMMSDPAFGPDGTVYSACGYYVYAYYPNGDLKWVYEAENYIYCRPAVLSDGGVAFIDYPTSLLPNTLFILNPDGTERWSKQIDSHASGDTFILGKDDVMFVTTGNGLIYAYDASGDKLWEYDTGSSSLHYPAIGLDGILLCRADSDHIFAINPDGTPKWTYELGDTFCSRIAVGSDGTIAFTCNDGYLYALTSDGDLKWTVPFSVDPAVGFSFNLVFDNNGNLYVDDPASNEVYSISPEGEIRWSLPIDHGLIWRILIDSEGTIYIVADDVRALNQDGSLKWRCNAESEDEIGGVAGLNGGIVCSVFEYLVAIDEDGNLLWRRYTYNEIFGNPVIDSDSNVYFTSRAGDLYAVDKDGNLKWQKNARAPQDGGPAIGTDGTIYCASYGYLSAVYPNEGLLRWSYSLDRLRRVLIGPDGTLYVASYDGDVHAVTPDGIQKWACQSGEEDIEHMVMSYDGTLIVSSHNGALVAVNSDGAVKWRIDLGGYLIESPTVGLNDTIYAITKDHILHVVNADGSIIREMDGFYSHSKQVAIGTDGQVYAPYWDDRIYVLNPEGEFAGTINIQGTTGLTIQSAIMLDANDTIYLCFVIQDSWKNSLRADDRSGRNDLRGK